ncbi:hypothetical protein [Sphingomonas oryzagri]|uniref:Uncharacterized protein n=1 Tax=Sphingomonas oryzagri TaxID=3042314 RepID=A0ABT6N3Y8_9SPHN|nr:hypothetical protein [Sphingomonas oryzagri]MDH7639484.1 hypothetical protein [Sphingomonas oryzagri]
MIDRVILKQAAIALFESVAREHPRGHQASKAARYIVTAGDGAEVEVMLEKNDGRPPNLWCSERAAGATLIAALKPKPSPAAQLHTKPASNGGTSYGRHSALQHMDQLGNADLVCFAPKSIAELGQITDRLLTVTKAELAG